MDWHGNLKRTELFQIYRGKGGEGGATLCIGCSCLFVFSVFVSSLFEISGYDESCYGAGYPDLDLVRRLAALVDHRLGKDMVTTPSFKHRCHEIG